MDICYDVKKEYPETCKKISDVVNAISNTLKMFGINAEISSVNYIEWFEFNNFSLGCYFDKDKLELVLYYDDNTVYTYNHSIYDDFDPEMTVYTMLNSVFEYILNEKMSDTIICLLAYQSLLYKKEVL